MRKVPNIVRKTPWFRVLISTKLEDISYPVNQKVTAWMVRTYIQVSSNFQFSFISSGRQWTNWLWAEERERKRGKGWGYHNQDSTTATTIKQTKKLIFDPDLLFHLFQRYSMQKGLLTQGLFFYRRTVGAGCITWRDRWSESVRQCIKSPRSSQHKQRKFNSC